MTKNTQSMQTDIQDLFINTAEVQLATLKAGIEFWSAWVDQANKFSEMTADNLAKLKENTDDAGEVMLGMLDTSRENMRVLTDLPLKASEAFSNSLKASRNTRKSTPKTKAKPKRRARVKD